jgi:glycosyltransferase involved in cell wall biosynthesis
VNDLVKQRSINDQILVSLYKEAIGFIFPSMYEGFGIPVLEAFACGCPTIVSNVSSLPEVAGDAVLYIDPLDKDSMIYAVEQLIHNKRLRDILTDKGYKQLAKFSWQKTVAETVKLYETIT